MREMEGIGICHQICCPSVPKLEESDMRKSEESDLRKSDKRNSVEIRSLWKSDENRLEWKIGFSGVSFIYWCMLMADGRLVWCGDFGVVNVNVMVSCFL